MQRLLDRLADRSRPVDAVIGYRIKRRDPFQRLVIAKTYNAIVSVLFGLRVRDIDCAMKVFRRRCSTGCGSMPRVRSSPPSCSSSSTRGA